MRRWILLALVPALVLPLALTAEAQRPRRDGSSRMARRQLLYVVGPNGRIEQVSNYVWLAPGRVGVPARIYADMGLSVNQSVDGRRLTIAVPGSGYVLSLKPQPRVFTRRAPNTAELGYEFPTAWKYRGQWYVAARAVQRAFPDLVRTVWDDDNYVLTVQSTEKLREIRQAPEAAAAPGR